MSGKRCANPRLGKIGGNSCSRFQHASRFLAGSCTRS
ncbi:Uncharacterised protein [Vibrio cholerae]|nr:Uncharacterised protein [Vibrio cholerae]